VTSLDIYLCQHGRTPLNREGRLRGRLDPELDLVGLAEARDLAALLGQLAPTRVISSPLKRAAQTAEVIAEAAGVEVELDDRLVDRSYGEFDGELSTEVAEKYGRPSAAPGVESTADLVARATTVLDGIVRDTESGPVVVVTHDAVIRYVLADIAPGYSPSELVPQRTGAWSLLRWADDAWTLVAFASKDDPIETVLGR
jgi:broad specificity phosphatase PhoE